LLGFSIAIEKHGTFGGSAQFVAAILADSELKPSCTVSYYISHPFHVEVQNRVAAFARVQSDPPSSPLPLVDVTVQVWRVIFVIVRQNYSLLKKDSNHVSAPFIVLPFVYCELTKFDI